MVRLYNISYHHLKYPFYLILIGLILQSNITIGQIDYAWHNTIESAYDDVPDAVTSNSIGDIFLACSFADSTVKVVTGNTASMLNVTYDDLGILRFDSSGTFLQSICINGSGYARITELYADDLGNVIAIGSYNGTYDFDPSAGVTSLSHNYDATFWVKYDSNGSLVNIHDISGCPTWAPFSGDFNSDGSSFRAFEPCGQIYVDGIALPLSGVAQIQILEIDSAGTISNHLLVDHNSSFNALYVYSSEYDSEGNYVIIGYSSIPGSNFGNPGNYYTIPEEGNFLVKIAPNGDCIFGMTYPTNTFSLAGIATLSNKRTAFVGSFNSSIDLDPGPNQFYLDTIGIHDITYGVLDSAGNLIFANNFGGNGWVIPNVIESDQYDNIYITGYLNEIIFAKPQIGMPQVNSNMWADDFIASFDQNGKCNFILPLESTSNQCGTYLKPYPGKKPFIFWKLWECCRF